MNNYFIFSNGNYFFCNINSVVSLSWADSDCRFDGGCCVLSVNDFVNKYINDNMVVSIIRYPSFAGVVNSFKIDKSITNDLAKEMLMSDIKQAVVKVNLANEIESKITAFLEDFIDIEKLGDIDININISSIGIRIKKESHHGYDINNPKI
jgi:hypothetical protein